MKDENVSKYMWWKASDDIKEARDFVSFELGNIMSDLWYRWIIELKSTNEIIGTCLIFYNDEEGENHWDISYNLGVKYWGNGYITEAMKQVMLFAKEKLHTNECITTYAKANPASGRILEKLGFKFLHEEPYLCSNGEIETEGIRVVWTIN